MNLRKATMLFLFFATVGIIGYDIFVYVKCGGACTISDVMLAWSKDYPILPFAFGVLCGHLFWPQKEKI